MLTGWWTTNNKQPSAGILSGSEKDVPMLRERSSTQQIHTVTSFTWNPRGRGGRLTGGPCRGDGQVPKPDRVTAARSLSVNSDSVNYVLWDSENYDTRVIPR